MESEGTKRDGDHPFKDPTSILSALPALIAFLTGTFYVAGYRFQSGFAQSLGLAVNVISEPIQQVLARGFIAVICLLSIIAMFLLAIYPIAYLILKILYKTHPHRILILYYSLTKESSWRDDLPTWFICAMFLGAAAGSVAAPLDMIFIKRFIIHEEDRLSTYTGDTFKIRGLPVLGDEKLLVVLDSSDRVHLIDVSKINSIDRPKDGLINLGFHVY